MFSRIALHCDRGDFSPRAPRRLRRPAPPKLGRPRPLMRSPRSTSAFRRTARVAFGSGSVSQGATVFAQKCAVCHGANAEGTPSGDRLVGGIGSLGTPMPLKTVASYWPYATTVFDYIRRAMPITNPQSLQNDEVYAVTAYILSFDNIVPKDAMLDGRVAGPRCRCPNRAGFVNWEPRLLKP